MNCNGPELHLCRLEVNARLSLPSTMLFHGLPGGDMQSVMEEMERRSKGDSTAISSAIDMGETETVSHTRFI